MLMSIKSLKTPLRYPGGKSKAIKTLSQWYPKIISEYREPFIGGGSIAIDVTKSNPDIPVWINDLYVPLYNFWVQLRDRGEELSERVREEKQNTLDEGDKEKVTASAKELFNKYKEEIDTYDDFEKAVAFFIMNKCSYSGLTENSTFSQTASNSNFSLVGADKLKEFSKLKEGYQQYLGNLIFWQMGNEGMVSHSLTFNESEMIAEISQGRFRKTIKAIDLASRILANNSPKNIDKITIVNLEQGVETLRASINRNDLVESVAKGPVDESLFIFNEEELMLQVVAQKIIVALFTLAMLSQVMAFKKA